MQAAAHVFSGASYCARFRVGHQFFVQGTYVDGAEPGPLRPALDLQRFVLTSVKHTASADGSYQNQFQAAPAAGLISGYSMQETQQGSVLGQVVAKVPGGRAEDWRYYQAGYADPEHSTLSDPGAGARLRTVGVYVRLSTAAPDAAPVWVKLAPHMQTAPEPGVTVLIARAQDESELPEIQSIIHNNGTTVVMPSGWSANSHVGSSYSTSYGDGRSVRFGQFSIADLDAAVARLDAAYGEGRRYREVSFAQGASYSFSCSELLAGAASDMGEMHGKYPGATDVLSASESFGSTYSRHHAQVVSSASNIGTAYTASTTGRSDTVSLVTGLSTSDATHEGDVESRTTLRAASRSTSDHYGDVTSTTTHHDGASVSSTTTVDGDSSTVSVIHGTLSSNSDHNVSQSVSQTNRQSNTSTVLFNETSDTNVLNKRFSITGVGGEISTTAMHNSVSVTGQSNTVQILGDSNSVEMSGPGAAVKQKGEQVGAETIDLNVTIIVAMQIYL
jgi:type VI secretion system secreted protein VgrG